MILRDRIIANQAQRHFPVSNFLKMIVLISGRMACELSLTSFSKDLQRTSSVPAGYKTKPCLHGVFSLVEADKQEVIKECNAIC